MLLRQLEYLVALARERHFARAAEACHVSQPSLSAGIAKLESELKVAIVVRSRRFIGFTPEGEQVIAWARRILADQDALHAELAAMQTGLGGTLRVCAIPTAVSTTSLLTAALCREHPAVRVRLESGTSRQIVRRLVDLDLDVGVSYVDNETLGPGSRVVPLYRERYLLLTPADGGLGERAEVTWADVAAEPLVLFIRDMQHRRILDVCFAQAGVEVSAQVETDSVGALYAHAVAGGFSTVVAHVWLELFGVPDGMRLVPITGPDRTPTIGLILADRHPEPALVAAVRDVVGGLDLEAHFDGVLSRHLDGR